MRNRKAIASCAMVWNFLVALIGGPFLAIRIVPWTGYDVLLTY